MDRDLVIQQMSDSFAHLKRAMHVYATEHFSHLGLSPAQIAVLRSIECRQPISHKALASSMQMTPGAISQLIEALDQAGSIVRTVSDTDRRVSYLSVSPKGQELLGVYQKHREQLISEATKDLPDSDLTSYINVQNALTSWLEAHSTSKK